MSFLNNSLNKVKSYFNKPSIVLQYWETEIDGPLPAFPVIVYDKSVPDDFLFHDHVRCFYNGFLGEEPDLNAIIIDKTGRVFNFKRHPEGFNYPTISQQVM